MTGQLHPPARGPVPSMWRTTVAALPTPTLFALSLLAMQASLAPAAAATVWLTPGQSITRAMQAAAPGDVILLADGIYDEEIGAGSAQVTGITVRAQQRRKAIIRPSRGNFVIGLSSNVNFHDVTFEGLVLDGINVLYDVVKITEGPHRITLVDCEVMNGRENGVLATPNDSLPNVDTNSGGNRFLDCEIHSNGRSGATTGNGRFFHGLYLSTTGNLVQGSSVHHNSGYGIHFFAGYPGRAFASRNAAIDNLVYDNSQYSTSSFGIILSSGTDLRAMGNIVYGQAAGGIQLAYDVDQATVADNVIYMGGVTYAIYIGGGTHTVSGNTVLGGRPASPPAVPRVHTQAPVTPDPTTPVELPPPPPVPALHAVKAAEGLRVDGVLDDPAWSDAEWTSFASAHLSDNQVRVSSAWDERALYLAFDVRDLHIETTAGADDLWKDDGAEIFLDAGGNASVAMDADEHHLLVSIDGAIHGPTGTISRTVRHQSGYVIEIALPWASLPAVPAPDVEFGLLLANNDRDRGVAVQFDWAGLVATGHYYRPSLWGRLRLLPPDTIVVAPTPAPPPPSPAPTAPPDGSTVTLLAARQRTHVVVDGRVQAREWSEARPLRFANARLSENEVVVRALWNSKHLLIAYEVVDADLEVSGDARSLHRDDGLELFLDAGNERGETTDGNDHHLLVSIERQTFGVSDVVVGVARSATGYSIEVAIPWASLEVSARFGATFGLLLGHNDRDRGVSSQFDAMGVIDALGTYYVPRAWGLLRLGSDADPNPDPTR